MKQDKKQTHTQKRRKREKDLVKIKIDLLFLCEETFLLVFTVKNWAKKMFCRLI